MIYGKKKDLARYLGLHPNLDILIHFVLEQDFSGFTLGRNEIDGDRAYANRFLYDTIPEREGFFEGHRAYGDLHVMLDGTEKIGVSDASTLTVTGGNPATDFIQYSGKVSCWCPMTTEDFLIVFPEDAHMVKIQDGEKNQVHKVCFKFCL